MGWFFKGIDPRKGTFNDPAFSIDKQNESAYYFGGRPFEKCPF
jgi:hypothetical protein